MAPTEMDLLWCNYGAVLPSASCWLGVYVFLGGFAGPRYARCVGSGLICSVLSRRTDSPNNGGQFCLVTNACRYRLGFSS